MIEVPFLLLASRFRRSAGRGGALVSLALVSLVGCADAPQPARGGALTVDDADFLGAVGDDRLSLDEAIRVASGTLDVSRLGAAERARIDGQPGRDAADVIRFAPGLRVALRRRDEVVGSILSPLTDPGDAIEGAGAVLDGAAMAGIPQRGPLTWPTINDEAFGTTDAVALLVLAASHTALRGLTIENVPATAVAVVGTSGQVTTGVRVGGNTIRGGGRNSFSGGIAVIAGVDSDDAAIENLEISDNALVDTSSGVFLAAGSSTGAGSAARRNRLSAIAVRRNHVVRPLSALVVYAGQAGLGSESADNRVASVELADNEVIDNLDVGILVSTTQAVSGGDSLRNEVRDLALRDNRLSWTGEPRANSGFYVSGGQMFAGGTSSGDRISQVVVERNRATGYGSAIQVYGGVAERCGVGCRKGESVFSGLALRDDEWRDVGTGILLVGGAGFEVAATVEGNTLSQVTIERETIEAREAGIVIAGSLAANLPLGGAFLGSRIRFPGYQEAGSERANAIRDVTVRASRVAAPSAIVISGGTMNRTEDTIEGSLVADLTLERNTIDGPTSGIVAVGGIVVGAGQVENCEVEGVRGAGNQRSDGDAAVPTALDQVATEGAAPSSVRGNRVSDVRLE